MWAWCRQDVPILVYPRNVCGRIAVALGYSTVLSVLVVNRIAVGIVLQYSYWKYCSCIAVALGCHLGTGRDDSVNYWWITLSKYWPMKSLQFGHFDKSSYFSSLFARGTRRYGPLRWLSFISWWVFWPLAKTFFCPLLVFNSNKSIQLVMRKPKLAC